MTGDDLAREVQARCDARVAEAVAAERLRIVETLRAAAAGRREYANRQPRGGTWDRVVELLEQDATTLEAAARVIEGDLGPLYTWLPSWRWTDEMVAALGGSPAVAENRGARTRSAVPGRVNSPTSVLPDSGASE